MPVKCTCVRCAALAVPAGYKGMEISAVMVSVLSHQLMSVRDGQGIFVKKGVGVGGWGNRSVASDP